MKRTRIWMSFAFIVVTALLVGAIFKSNQRNRAPLYQLSRYPQTPAFTRYISDLSNASKNPQAASKEAMFQMEFPYTENFNAVWRYQISQNGGLRLHPIFPLDTASDSGMADLSVGASQLASIRTLMRQLPYSAPPAERKNLLIVSLYEPQRVQLLLYDRKHLPPQIHEIFRLLGAAIKNNSRPSNAQRAVN